MREKVIKLTRFVIVNILGRIDRTKPFDPLTIDVMIKRIITYASGGFLIPFH